MAVWLTGRLHRRCYDTVILLTATCTEVMTTAIVPTRQAEMATALTAINLKETDLIGRMFTGKAMETYLDRFHRAV